jgi:hypothetical protein
MADTGKNLCKWSKKTREKHLDELRDIVKQPTHLCAKCGRAAAGKKQLCKPVPLHDKKK